LKWERIAPLGEWFAERLAEVAKREGSPLAADVVVPVPFGRDREGQRGYNQAGLVSRAPGAKAWFASRGSAVDEHAPEAEHAGP
jgi:predicted amidophosphoribosyltransferase